jgi:hypothetical protein
VKHRGPRTALDQVATTDGLLALQSPEIARLVAAAFGWNRGPRTSLIEGELDLLKKLAVSQDPSIRHSAAVAAQRIATQHPQEALDLLAMIPFRDAPNVADEIFAGLMSDGPLTWEHLSEAQQTAFDQELVELDRLDDYHVVMFLSQRSATDPRDVIDLFQRRILRATTLNRLDRYRPTPRHWQAPLRIREHRDFLSILRELHDWISAAAGAFDDAVLTLLREGLARPTEASVDGVAAILRKAHRTIVYTDVPFVLEALDAAARFGKHCEQTMGGAFWAATVTGSRMGTPGQPFPEDIQQRDECLKIAQALPKASRGARFYTALAQSAEESIRRGLALDARDDHRDW